MYLQSPTLTHFATGSEERAPGSGIPYVGQGAKTAQGIMIVLCVLNFSG